VIALWSTVTIPILYLWGAWWFGRNSGLLAAALWTICPNILAHAGLVTTDVPAASAGLIAAYFFARWLDRRTWLRAALVGVALGLAQLVKFTSLGLYPLLTIWGVASWVAHVVTRQRAVSRRQSKTVVLAQIVFAILSSLFVVNAGYLFEGTFTRLGDFPFVSDSLTRPRTIMDPPPPKMANKLYEDASRLRSEV
jgi:predicted membrane-bound dolichyl-phosphate-mannose-protein mannosyltransferase